MTKVVLVEGAKYVICTQKPLRTPASASLLPRVAPEKFRLAA